MRKVIVSIIIPVYNAEKYLSRCLESILEQTYKDYEVVIVDDGSTDSTAKIIEEYIRKYNFIRKISQKNSRAAAARNNGIRNAHGEYIAFIDADDYIHKEYINILYNNLRKYDADVSTCNFYCSSESNMRYIDISRNNPVVRSNIEVMYECCDINKTAITSPCCKLYKKILFEGIEYPEGRTYEDLATTHKILYKADKVVTTKLPLYCYFNTKESVVHGKYNYLNFWSENLAQDERLLFFVNIGVDDLNKKNMIAVERNRITNYCRGILYLKEHKKECLTLKEKYDQTLHQLEAKYALKWTDYMLFKGFEYFPNIYVYVLYRLYCIYNKIKRK